MNGAIIGWFAISVISLLFGILMVEDTNKNVQYAGYLFVLIAAGAFGQVVEFVVIWGGGLIPMAKAGVNVRTKIKALNKKNKKKRQKGGRR